MSGGQTTNEGEDEEVRILPGEDPDKLYAEEQPLEKHLKDYATLRPHDEDSSAVTAIEDQTAERIKATTKKLAHRATLAQRIKEHATAVDKTPAKFNDLERQIGLLTKEYNEQFATLTASKRALGQARLASFKEL